MKLSIIIPTLNGKELVEDCLLNLIKYTYYIKNNSGYKSKEEKGDVEIIIIDDNSKFSMFKESIDQTLEESNILVRFIRKEKPTGVTDSWNIGLNEAQGEYVAVINNDIIVGEDWDKKLIDELEKDKEVMLVSPYHTRNVFGALKPTTHLNLNNEMVGGFVPSDYPNGKDRHSNNMCGFLGCCFMLRKEDWKNIGPIDNEIKIWYNDNWLINKVTKTLKKKIKEVKDSYVHHFYSKTCNETARPGFVAQTDKDAEEFKKLCKKYKW